MSSITVPEGFPYVGGALLSTVVLLLGQSSVVNSYRRRSGVKYPQMYAEASQAAASNDALLFNCAQRAHQNTLENIPMIYLTSIIAGLKYPILAASLCGFWALTRVSYTRGYLTGDPSKRVTVLYKAGAFSFLGLFLTSVYTVGDFIISK